MVVGPVNREERADKPAWKPSKTVVHAMRLLTFEICQRMHGLLANNTLYALEED